MHSSPLSLKNYFTTALTFSATPDFDEKSGGYNIDINDLTVEIKEFKNEENFLDRACEIFIALKDEATSRYPYDFSISLIGFFEVTPKWDTEMVDKLVSSNAPALLYSAARHALATATGTGPYSKVILPTVTFVKLEEDKLGDESQKKSEPQLSKNNEIITDVKAKVPEKKDETKSSKSKRK